MKKLIIAILPSIMLFACSAPIPKMDSLESDRYKCFDDGFYWGENRKKTNCLILRNYKKLLRNGETQESVQTIMSATQFLVSEEPGGDYRSNWHPFNLQKGYKNFCSNALTDWRNYDEKSISGGTSYGINHSYDGVYLDFRKLIQIRKELQIIWDKSCRFKEVENRWNLESIKYGYNSSGDDNHNICLFDSKNFAQMKELSNQYYEVYLKAREYDDKNCPQDKAQAEEDRKEKEKTEMEDRAFIKKYGKPKCRNRFVFNMLTDTSNCLIVFDADYASEFYVREQLPDGTLVGNNFYDVLFFIGRNNTDALAGKGSNIRKGAFRTVGTKDYFDQTYKKLIRIE